MFRDEARLRDLEYESGCFAGQRFHEAEAYKLFPEGCQCTDCNGGGDCDWCQVYYYGSPEEMEQAEREAEEQETA